MTAAKLGSLTTAELGKLFPITVVDPDPSWPKIYASERDLLVRTLPSNVLVRIEHIGSTAIARLRAKPTIDMLLEISAGTDLQSLAALFNRLEYKVNTRPDKPPPHLTLVKGYTERGFSGQSFHVHVRYKDTHDEIYFRDYLRTHPATAREYEVLKDALAEKFRNDREAYTEGKSEFVKRVVGMARESYSR